MTVLRGDCVEVMAGMEPDSIDAIVTDPPYGLEFMGRDWDRLDAGLPQENVWKGRRGSGGATVRDDDSKPSSRHHVSFGGGKHGFKRCTVCGKRQFSGTPCTCAEPVWVIEYPPGAPSSVIRMERWHAQWAAAALRVAKPGAYLLAFGGTRTVHRMTTALEDAGWIVRDMLVWAYAQGFPKSRASLKPAWEPIVLCRKPGPLRDLNIDAARIGTEPVVSHRGLGQNANLNDDGWKGVGQPQEPTTHEGRWPSNVLLTAPILDGGWEGVVGGGWQSGGGNPARRGSEAMSRAYGGFEGGETGLTPTDTEGTYSRFFLIPKAPTRERVLSDGRRSPHPTQKPEALIRHLVTLVTPKGGTVLDPFLGSGTLGVVCDGLGMSWVGIEREAEYADWAEDRVRDGRPSWEVAS